MIDCEAFSGRTGATRDPITRVFVKDMLEAGATRRLAGDEARHVLKVLRGKPGDSLELVSADRRVFAGELRAGGEVRILEELSASPDDPVEVALYQAVPKGKRMDVVVEKAVELGVTRISPLLTERSVVRPGGGGKVERWRRLAESAARQALRRRVPEVAEPVPFPEAVWESGREGLLLHNGEGLPPLESAVASPAALFIGPEGGWSEGELRFARESGLTLVQLGPYRLRSETAGIAAVARARAVLQNRVRKP